MSKRPNSAPKPPVAKVARASVEHKKAAPPAANPVVSGRQPSGRIAGNKAQPAAGAALADAQAKPAAAPAKPAAAPAKPTAAKPAAAPAKPLTAPTKPAAASGTRAKKGAKVAPPAPHPNGADNAEGRDGRKGEDDPLEQEPPEEDPPEQDDGEALLAQIEDMERRHQEAMAARQLELENMRQALARLTKSGGTSATQDAAPATMLPAEYLQRGGALERLIQSRWGENGMKRMQYRDDLGQDLAALWLNPLTGLERLTESNTLTASLVQETLLEHILEKGAVVKAHHLATLPAAMGLTPSATKDLTNVGSQSGKNLGSLLISQFGSVVAKIEESLYKAFERITAAEIHHRLAEMARLVDTVASAEANLRATTETRTNESDRQVVRVGEWANAYRRLEALFAEGKRLEVEPALLRSALDELLTQNYQVTAIPDGWDHTKGATLAFEYYQLWKSAFYARTAGKGAHKSEPSKPAVAPSSRGSRQEAPPPRARPDTQALPDHGRGAASAARGERSQGSGNRAPLIRRPTTETHRDTLAALDQRYPSYLEVRELEVCKDWNGLTGRDCTFGERCHRHHLCLECVRKGTTGATNLDHKASSCRKFPPRR